MAIQKQNLNIPFAQGIDTKTDPKQVTPGKFLALNNTVFGTGNLLKKRNGFKALTSLPDGSSTSLTTFNGNLLALGQNVQALSQESSQWVNAGYIQPINLEVLPMVRSSTSQKTVDLVVAKNGLAISTWLDSDGNCYYQVTDSVTGQIVVSYVQLPATAACPRVFALGNFFIVTFLATVSAATHLQYIAVPLYSPSTPGIATDISSQAFSLSAGYDGYVSNNALYLAFNASDAGGAIRITYLDTALNLHTPVVLATQKGSLVSVTADTTGGSPIIWVTYWITTGGNNGYSVAYNSQLIQIMGPTNTIVGTSLKTLTSAASGGVLKIFAEVNNTYSYTPNAVTDYIQTITCTTAAVVGSPDIILRGVGLASKAFYLPLTGKRYVLATYAQTYQPTYFLIDENGNVVAKVAYSNGAGLAFDQILPCACVEDSSVYIGYLIKDLLASVNKTQGVANVDGVYSQTGINLSTFNFTNISNSQEVGGNVNITGGITWAYDGVKPTEQGFNVWPEDITTVPSTSGGSMNHGTYFYQVTYEWTDAQGNLFRSAPSVPVEAVIGGGGSTGSVVLNIPNLRITYKTDPNPVRIVIYRWSAAQQTYYQVTSITSPIMNDPSTDSVAYTDTLADASILGNVVLYTNGGVIENIAPPSFADMSLFKNRLLGIDSEDRNLLWYSKQIIQSTPVEMSDLFTIYVSPTTGAQGSTGPMTCLSALDDKAIIFKKDAIYYFVGTGPDNTGTQNDFSEPVFITSTVGCSNKKSIVFMPQGLMFQSDKGIWLLGRDLSTVYIGAPVEKFNDNLVLSAINVPGTNQVRFTLDNGVTLMYDYFYNQWGTFTGISNVSSTIYQGFHTFINKYGESYQENPNSYLDGSNPVLVSFATGWMNFAGLQGFERAYYFYILAEFFSPHKIQIQVAYDYAQAPQQTSLIVPDNYSGTYGYFSPYGEGSPYGGTPSLEQWRVFFQQQKCQAFQIILNEVYDASYEVKAGAGLTISGLNLVFGLKKGFRPIYAKNSVG